MAELCDADAAGVPRMAQFLSHRFRAPPRALTMPATALSVTSICNIVYTLCVHSVYISYAYLYRGKFLPPRDPRIRKAPCVALYSMWDHPTFEGFVSDMRLIVEVVDHETDRLFDAMVMLIFIFSQPSVLFAAYCLVALYGIYRDPLTFTATAAAALQPPMAAIKTVWEAFSTLVKKIGEKCTSQTVFDMAIAATFVATYPDLLRAVVVKMTAP